jgi:tetratricopeptide (TPR) repeat protein
MKFRILCISLGTSFLCACVGALWSQALKLPIECERINAVSSQIAQGQIDDAMHAVSQILAGDSSGREPACLALVSNNLAAGLQMSGRLKEARTFAEQAIKYFGRAFPADDPVYLAPLHILATMDLEQGLTAGARQVFIRMQNIGTTQLQDRMLVLSISASLLLGEGSRQEAESQFNEALSAISQARKQNSADAVLIRVQLAYSCLQEQRYEDAKAILNRALASVKCAPEAVPLIELNF